MNLAKLRWASALLCVSLLGACGDDGSQPDAVPRDTGLSADTNTDAPNEGVFIVDFDTSAGSFSVEVHDDWSPNGAAHFRDLVESGYYNDQRIFRVVPGFVAQWGISGTPANQDTRTIADDPVVESNARGTLSFAKTTEPNSRGSQVFINYTDNAFLNGMGFSPFGRVVDGLDVVDAFNGEYGDTPVQAQIVAEGNAYLDASFPNLTQIRSATIR
ncbi:MAG: peptidyl-prolyl cis-trans isomerase A (cyclophilin A) [Polyangiales bacterium]|jgi:peptidyl-prolyl cis-trans isomerase A (cyclophilin A)